MPSEIKQLHCRSGPSARQAYKDSRRRPLLFGYSEEKAMLHRLQIPFNGRHASDGEIYSINTLHARAPHFTV